jgi:hypothetical protein
MSVSESDALAGGSRVKHRAQAHSKCGAHQTIITPGPGSRGSQPPWPVGSPTVPLLSHQRDASNRHRPSGPAGEHCPASPGTGGSTWWGGSRQVVRVPSRVTPQPAAVQSRAQPGPGVGESAARACQSDGGVGTSFGAVGSTEPDSTALVCPGGWGGRLIGC